MNAAELPDDTLVYMPVAVDLGGVPFEVLPAGTFNKVTVSSSAAGAWD